MNTIVAVITLLIAIPSILFGGTPSIKDVNCLSGNEMKQLMTSHSVTLSEEQCEKLLQVISTFDADSAESFQELAGELQELASALREQRGEITLPQFSLIQDMDLKEHLDVFRDLSRHPDISLRFFSLLMRIKNFDLSASNELQQLIADETLSVEDKRILKTWCVNIGLDIVNDSAQDIYVHFQLLNDNDLKPKIGDKAPSFEITDIHGNVVTLAQFKGKPVLVHFWATWCGPCMSEIDRVNTYVRQMVEQDKVVVIGVSLDQNEAAFKAAIKKHNLNWIHNFEGKGWGTNLGKLFKVNAVPQDFVIDKNGIVFSYDYQDLGKALNDNDANKRVEPVVPSPAPIISEGNSETIQTPVDEVEARKIDVGVFTNNPCNLLIERRPIPPDNKVHHLFLLRGEEEYPIPCASGDNWNDVRVCSETNKAFSLIRTWQKSDNRWGSIRKLVEITFPLPREPMTEVQTRTLFVEDLKIADGRSRINAIQSVSPDGKTLLVIRSIPRKINEHKTAWTINAAYMDVATGDFKPIGWK